MTRKVNLKISEKIRNLACGHDIKGKTANSFSKRWKRRQKRSWNNNWKPLQKREEWNGDEYETNEKQSAWKRKNKKISKNYLIQQFKNIRKFICKTNRIIDTNYINEIFYN